MEKHVAASSSSFSSSSSSEKKKEKGYIGGLDLEKVRERLDDI